VEAEEERVIEINAVYVIVLFKCSLLNANYILTVVWCIAL